MENNNQKFFFSQVSLLITHYNRSSSLERLLRAFSDLGCQFGEIIISDDGSKNEHQVRIKELLNTYKFKLITAKSNRGLGNNINKGQRKATLPYILYVQEDFYPLKNFPEILKKATSYLMDDSNLDLVRFYSYINHPNLQPYSNGFSEMVFNPFALWYDKFWIYSDHPHLKRRSFDKKFGIYIEGCNPEQTEYRMMINFLKKNGKGIFYKDYQLLFEQRNSNEEPSTMKRDLKFRRSENAIIKFVRDIYRYMKYHLDYIFSRYHYLPNK